MARQHCTNCSASIPASAKFCPRCGRESSREVTGAAPAIPGAVPAKSRMPLAGVLFLAAAVLGPSLIAVGAYAAIDALLYAGIGVAVLLIVLLLLGMFF